MTTNSKQRGFIGNTRGFTLIEILIALAIFSIGILGVAKLQLWNVKNNTTGNITTIATMMARAKIDEQKGKSLSEMSNGVEHNIDANGEPGGIFNRDCTVLPLGLTQSQIDVTVSWKRRGQNRSVVLTTITRGNGT
jgi:type IV pilus assembly protein PilV